MGRPPCCANVGLNRGSWTADEDLRLCTYVQTHGGGRWSTIPNKTGLLRSGKSCRLRWKNYLRPDVNTHMNFIIRLHRLLGNRWTLIAGRIPGRTDNDIKNYWNTHLRKKLVSQGIDPRTHKPLSESPEVRVSSGDGDTNPNTGLGGPSKESTGRTEKEDNVDQSNCNQISQISRKCNQIPEKSSHPFPDVMDSFQDQRTCITEPYNNAFINNSLKGSCQTVRPARVPLDGQMELSHVSCVSGNAPFDTQVMSKGLEAFGMEVQVSVMTPSSVANFNIWSNASFEDPASGIPPPTTTTLRGSAYGDYSSDMFSSLLESFVSEEYHFLDSNAYTTVFNTKCTASTKTV